MFIRVVSDLHLEFCSGFWKLPELPEDNQTVLVLAGDIGLGDKAYTYMPFIDDVAERFQDVIFIMGNHEHYKGKFPVTHTKIWNATIEHENVHVLEKESIVIGDVAFICATLWTDMNNMDALCIERARGGMNDYNLIRTGPLEEPWKKTLHPHDTIADFRNARHFIFEEIKKQKANGKKVMVVTHHGPSYQSVPDEFKGDILNGAYVSELSEDIFELEDSAPEVWIHGHTHNSFDYNIGATRVVVNPRGYDTGRASDLNQEFDPLFRIEL